MMDTWLAVSILIAFIASASLLAQILRVPVHRDRLPVASSPLDHAERILASRYARHEISAEEYGRMLVVLRS